MYTELGKLLHKSNILHITSYFLENVIYYSYILLKMQSNLIILQLRKLLYENNLQYFIYIKLLAIFYLAILSYFAIAATTTIINSHYFNFRHNSRVFTDSVH